MINIIGAKRVVILAVLIVVNGLLAAGVYTMLAPRKQALDTELSQSTGKIATARSETERLRNEIDEIKKQKAQFERLQAADLFSSQDRVQARDRFEAMQRFSRVLLASYDISPAATESTEGLTAAGHIILTTPVKVQIDALDDLDFYNFAYLLKNAYPGFVRIDKIELSRIRDLNDVTLRQIGSGIPTVMIRGSIEFTWKTIVPQAMVQNGSAPQTGL